MPLFLKVHWCTTAVFRSGNVVSLKVPSLSPSTSRFAFLRWIYSLVSKRISTAVALASSEFCRSSRKTARRTRSYRLELHRRQSTHL